MEDEAGGDARLVLGAVVEASKQVIDLDGTNPDVRDDFQVDAGADCGSEGGVGVTDNKEERIVGDGPGSDGLMCAAEQQVSKRRDAGRKRNLGACKTGVLVDVAGSIADGAVVGAEIGGDAEERKKTIGSGEFIAIEVFAIGGIDQKNGFRRADEVSDGAVGLGDRDGRAKIGIAAEDDEMVLSVKRGREEKGCDEKNKCEDSEFEH